MYICLNRCRIDRVILQFLCQQNITCHQSQPLEIWRKWLLKIVKKQEIFILKWKIFLNNSLCCTPKKTCDTAVTGPNFGNRTRTCDTRDHNTAVWPVPVSHPTHPHIEMKKSPTVQGTIFFGQSLKMRFRISEIPNIKENYKKLTNLISNKVDLRDAQLGLFANWWITNLSPSTYFEAIKAYDTRDHFCLVWA